MADNEHRSLDELLKKLPPEDAGEIVKSVVKVATDAIDSSVSRLTSDLVPKVFELVREQLGFSDAVLAEIQNISSESGDSYEDLLLKALLLYKAALEATQKGQRLVVVGPDYRFIREIVGIGSANREPVESGSNAR